MNARFEQEGPWCCSYLVSCIYVYTEYHGQQPIVKAVIVPVSILLSIRPCLSHPSPAPGPSALALPPPFHQPFLFSTSRCFYFRYPLLSWPAHRNPTRPPVPSRLAARSSRSSGWCLVLGLSLFVFYFYICGLGFWLRY